MSRFGKLPILLSNQVDVKIEGQDIEIKGAKGLVKHHLPAGLVITRQEQALLIHKVSEETAISDAMHGLQRALVNNIVIGVSKGFEKKLSLIGVGYRASVQGHLLDLQLGYSHPVKLQIPSGVQVSVDKSVTIVITGIDKHAVGQFAAKVRAQRPPEPYKGKGIRYENEYVRKKAGKAAKGKTA